MDDNPVAFSFFPETCKSSCFGGNNAGTDGRWIREHIQRIDTFQSSILKWETAH